jgi:hypothetical protein
VFLNGRFLCTFYLLGVPQQRCESVDYHPRNAHVIPLCACGCALQPRSWGTGRPWTCWTCLLISTGAKPVVQFIPSSRWVVL